MAASVEGDARLRLFLALPLPREAAARLVRWQEETFEGVRARPVSHEHLHLTLAFLGHRPAVEVPAISEVMAEAAASAERPAFRAVRYRESRSVGMVLLEEDDDRGARLAADLAGRLERLGVYEPERRPWLPHVTVLRFRERPGLQPPTPDLGEVSPSEVALYHSVLRPSGAQYEIRESVALGG